MTVTTEESIASSADVRPVLKSWRDEFGSANTTNLALRIAFPIVACASLLPFVSPGIALMVGIALALTLGNPYPLTTARVITPLLQISVIGLGAGMNLVEVGRAGVHGFFYNDERPRSIWNDQLNLAERLQLNPPLIPADIGERMLMFGLANELCGENGLGWARRLMMIHSSLTNPDASEGSKKGTRFLGAKYDYSEQGAEAAPARVAQILMIFNRQLEVQRKRGSRFLVGDHLSAVDLYWAAFAALIQPLPDELCQMHPGFRKMYDCKDPVVNAASDPQLFAHRDFVYHEYLELPVDM
jgi:hypothetical protein